VRIRLSGWSAAKAANAFAKAAFLLAVFISGFLSAFRMSGAAAMSWPEWRLGPLGQTGGSQDAAKRIPGRTH
jgi:hypothetical protein